MTLSAARAKAPRLPRTRPDLKVTHPGGRIGAGELHYHYYGLYLYRRTAGMVAHRGAKTGPNGDDDGIVTMQRT